MSTEMPTDLSIFSKRSRQRSRLPTQRSVMHWPRRSTPTLKTFPTSSTGSQARRLRRSSVTCLRLSMWRVARRPSPSRGRSFA